MVQRIKKRFIRSQKNIPTPDEAEEGKGKLAEALVGCRVTNLSAHCNSRAGNVYKIFPEGDDSPSPKRLAKILNNASGGHVTAKAQKGGFVEANVQPRSESEDVISALVID